MLYVDIVYLVCRGKEYDTIHLIVELTAQTTNNQSINPIKIVKTGGRLSTIIIKENIDNLNEFCYYKL